MTAKISIATAGALAPANQPPPIGAAGSLADRRLLRGGHGEPTGAGAKESAGYGGVRGQLPAAIYCRLRSTFGF